MPTPSLTLNIARTTAVRVPLTYALGTSAAIVTSVPLLLLDLETREGVVGRCYIFCYTTSGAKAVAAHLVDAVERLRGSPIHPQTLADQMARRFALIGVTGTVRMALSALDMALWDACACAEGKPVADLLGGTRRPIRAYDSRGLGLMDPARLAAEAESMRASGLPAMKLRLGHPTLAEDLAALHAVRGAIGDDVLLMVDYNQALLPTEAILRGRAIEDQGVVWLEEPIRHDDYPGNARIARELTIPIQIGENFNGPEALRDALDHAACDYAMPDVSRIGGVTGWMRAAGIAAAHGIELSSHLMPEISAHLLSASPTAHWLEYVDWADAVLEEPLHPVNGTLTPPDRPGFGIAWSRDKLRHLDTI